MKHFPSINLSGIRGRVSRKALAVGAGALAIGGIAIAGIRSRRARSPTLRKKTKKKAGKSTKRKTSKKNKGRTGHKHKHRGTKQIHLTKKGQPYIILSSGKARFISKKSAKLRRKRKGGNY